jgi:hypothetical protein
VLPLNYKKFSERLHIPGIDLKFSAVSLPVFFYLVQTALYNNFQCIQNNGEEIKSVNTKASRKREKGKKYFGSPHKIE